MDTLIESADTNKVRYPGFAKRFEQACEANPDIPPLSAGRYSYLRRKILEQTGDDLSRNTLTRWGKGIASPKKKYMGLLATILKVDFQWLYTGMNDEDVSTGTPKSKDLKKVAGLQSLLFGAMIQAKIPCGFPADDWKSDLVHFTATINYMTFGVHVCTVRQREDELEIELPEGFESVAKVVIISNGFMQFSVFNLTTEVVKNSGGILIAARVTSRGLQIGDQLLKPISSFNEIRP